MNQNFATAFRNGLNRLSDKCRAIERAYEEKNGKKIFIVHNAPEIKLLDSLMEEKNIDLDEAAKILINDAFNARQASIKYEDSTWLTQRI